MSEFSNIFSIESLAGEVGMDASSSFSAAFAAALDAADGLAPMRERFLLPPAEHPGHSTSGESSNDSVTKPAIYLCGNSLGLQPRHLGERITQQLNKWAALGVEGHFTKPDPWLTFDDIVQESSARLVGALPSEVVVMNTLTVNLHFMMASFYRPTPERFKILTEKKAFPSDTHAVVSQLRLHGYSAETALIEVAPREGEQTLRDEDILQVRASRAS
jgi:kynureninase